MGAGVAGEPNGMRSALQLSCQIAALHETPLMNDTSLLSVAERLPLWHTAAVGYIPPMTRRAAEGRHADGRL